MTNDGVFCVDIILRRLRVELSLVTMFYLTQSRYLEELACSKHLSGAYIKIDCE